MREFRVNQTIWHGSRYWVNLGDYGGGYPGWNTRFLPYQITKIGPKRITCVPMNDSQLKTPVVLKRDVMERLGKQYHTRFHEYFYAEKPEADPERRYRGDAPAPSILNLPVPYSRDDVRRAYKRLARTMHPDAGGSESQFIELKRAHDEALRSAI